MPFSYGRYYYVCAKISNAVEAVLKDVIMFISTIAVSL